MTLPPLVAPGPALTADQVARYSRHLLMPAIGEGGQRRLLAARIAVVGAGGLGSPSLLYLAAAGVGSITLIDDDVVEESNLQRQVLHSADDIGRAKTDSAVERLRALNPDVAVNPVDRRLDPTNAQELLAGHDLVLDGSDSFDTRYAVADACDALGLPLVWAAVLRTEAQVTVFWTAAPESVPAPGLRDLFPVPPAPGSVPACGDAGVLGPLVGQIGSMMATEAIKLITGCGEPLLGRLLFVDVLTATQREIPLLPRHDRPRRTPVPSPGDAASPGAAGNGDVETAATADAATDVRHVSPAELAARLAGDDAPFVIDVRDAHELAEGTVAGAVHIPVADLLSDSASTRDIPSDREVVLVCRAGPRARLAATALLARGHERLLVLDGGMLTWPDPVPHEETT